MKTDSQLRLPCRYVRDAVYGGLDGIVGETGMAGTVWPEGSPGPTGVEIVDDHREGGMS